jgi:hypothetical protein
VGRCSTDRASAFKEGTQGYCFLDCFLLNDAQCAERRCLGQILGEFFWGADNPDLKRVTMLEEEAYR